MTKENLDDSKESIRAAMAFSSRDWSIDHVDAWIYGIVFGYDDESMDEVKKMHRWPAEDIARLKRLHNNFIGTEVATT